MNKQGRLARIIGASVLVVALVVVALGCLKNGPQKFYLDIEYYGESSLEEINGEGLKNLIDGGGSFGVFVSQPLCVVSNELTKVLMDFQAEHAIKFYKVAFSEVKGLGLMEEMKYYPSFAVYHEGRLMDFLEADKEEDTEKYKSLEAFSEWVGEWVELDSHG